jgi:beta-alanine degradation protein BauB
MKAMLTIASLFMLAGCARSTPIESESATAEKTRSGAPTVGASSAPAQPVKGDTADPATTDPDKYKVVLDNERVRVLRYHDKPGDKTNVHHHPDSVLYALSTFRRRLTFPDHRTKELELKTGDVMWVPAQTHVGENIGTTETEVLLVEVKR